MLIAHVVPGYFAIELTKQQWDDSWSQPQRWFLGGLALASTIWPDTDVVYNILIRGFANHSTLWTHSLWVYLGLAVASVLCFKMRLKYAAWCWAFMAWGGFSHLILDAIAHKTPLLYPLSTQMIGIAPESVVEGGITAYIQHPLFLLEIILWGAAFMYFRYTHQRPLNHLH